MNEVTACIASQNLVDAVTRRVAQLRRVDDFIAGRELRHWSNGNPVARVAGGLPRLGP